MTKPMKYRKLAGMLREAGFDSRQGKGDHEVWRNGGVTVTVTQGSVASPKVVRDALRAIERSRA